jgi:hypothetical protein
VKTLLKTLFTFFLALTMSTPTEVLANPAPELNDVVEEGDVYSAEPDEGNYTMMFLRSDFGMSLDKKNISDQVGSLVMFIANPEQKIVKNAQVVVTLISQSGEQTMTRARPYKGGYFISTDSLLPGRYRLEAEVLTEGWLLTDQFHFEHV